MDRRLRAVELTFFAERIFHKLLGFAAAFANQADDRNVGVRMFGQHG